jgi:magnesium transporter
MDEARQDDPGHELERLVQSSADHEVIEAFLDSLSPGDASRAIADLSEEERNRLLLSIDPDDAADLLGEIPEVQASDLLEGLPPDSAAAILEYLPSDEKADLLGGLEDEEAEAILSVMEPEAAQALRALKDYPRDVAGGLMITELIVYDESATVTDVIDDLRSHADRYRDYPIQYAYVTSHERLVGVIPLRSLLLAPRSQKIGSIMIRNPISVENRIELDTLRELFTRHEFFGFPVIDAGGQLVGTVLREAVDEELQTRAGSDYQKAQGIVVEELRSMPLLLRSRRRLSWLTLNIPLNLMAASIIAIYQETLQAVIALAVFLPIISDMSGCSGNQAVAVSMRELSLGIARPSDIVRIWLKEVFLGLINGAALGMIMGLVAYLWKGNAWLGLVVGGALCINTVVAVSLGGTIPLVLKGLRRDPAVASGPLLTTVTDLFGFFLALSFASLCMTRLVPATG